MGTRTEKFLQLQNLRAHYKNMVSVEPTYTLPKNIVSKDVFKKVRLHHMKKSQKQRQLDIMTNNLHLVSNLRKIDRRQGNCRHIPDFTTIHTSRSERRSHHGSQAHWIEVQRQNLHLVRRLKSVSPTVATEGEWKKSARKHREQLKRLSKSTNLGHTKEERIVEESLNTLKTILVKPKRIYSAKTRGRYFKQKQNPPHSQRSTHNGASIYDEVQQDCIRQLKEQEIYQES